MPVTIITKESLAQAVQLATRAALEQAIKAVEDAGGDNAQYHANAIRALLEPSDGL